jgi:hypothetical protein
MADQPGESTTSEPPNNRLTVAQAADQLGISEDAVRSRIKRGTLRAERENGAVVVLLDTDRPATSQPTDKPTDRDQLLEELRERVRSLEESNRENRRIIAGLVQRIPELEAPQDPQSAQEAQDVAESGSEGESRETAPEEPQATTSQGSAFRSWWRRLFGRR